MMTDMGRTFGSGVLGHDVPPAFVVGFGFRGAGFIALAAYGGMAVLALVGSVGMQQAGESASAVAVVGALGVASAGYVVALAALLASRRVAAILSPRGIALPWVADPALREWDWSEIQRIEVMKRDARGVTYRSDFLLQLHPSARASALESVSDDLTGWQRRWVHPAGPASFSIGWMTAPAPRHVRRYIYAVAPELGLPLIPPRHRPKGYPWGENRSTGPEE
ncbi:hypothetical protein ASU32_06150 [Tsukamurella tyrosinosolvens]|nr:hypothetical protein ASU32_06150 [Tsukamurella tyrosinosolvens]